MTRAARYRASVLVVSLLVGGAPAYADGREAGGFGGPAGFFASLWRSLVELLPPAGELPDPPTPQNDIGSTMDPNG